MSLSIYARKRDFASTVEPRPHRPRPRGDSGRLFVIQKHAASHLHYDLRLELEGTLKSWAVPKGLPFLRGEKHLAVAVEDHPLDYATFEGGIPKGQYGGGTVMVWDTGTYEMPDADGAAKQKLRAGKLRILLNGRKVHGEWTLTRMHGSESQDWLLIKTGGPHRPVSKKKDNESILSGRTMAQIARDANRRSHARKFGKLEFVPPMKATLVAEPPTSGDWQYELKFDGYRALVLKNGDDVRIMSSNARDFTGRFPELVGGVSGLRADTAIFDGEIVAMDDQARPRFTLLQTVDIAGERPPLALYVFDLLHLNGSDLADEPLCERRGILEKLICENDDPIRFSAEIRGDPLCLLAEVRRMDLEGLIGKERQSVYESGRRSRSWIKLKCVREQEMVIGGYTSPKGGRKYFGALLVGYFENGKLQFASKVGTGFNTKRLAALHARMRALKRATSPFADRISNARSGGSQKLPSHEMADCHWVTPDLVCQVRFTEWTSAGRLRHPVFIGLREDKPARKVVRESPGV